MLKQTYENMFAHLLTTLFEQPYWLEISYQLDMKKGERERERQRGGEDKETETERDRQRPTDRQTDKQRKKRRKGTFILNT